MEELYHENVELSELEFRRRKITLACHPKRIMIRLTNACNYRCTMCRSRLRQKDITLPYEYIKQLKELLPYLDYVAWQGGEVFLVDYFKDLFREISTHPRVVQEITTNASLLSREWAELITTSRTRLIVSIDSLKTETYSRIRQGGALNRVVENLDVLRKAEERNAGKYELHAGINVIVMKSNYRELEDFVPFARQYGFDFLNFMYLVDTLAPQENIFDPLDRQAVEFLRERMPEIIARADENGIKVVYEFRPILENPGLFPQPQRARAQHVDCICKLPWVRVFIDGADEEIKVYPECICYQPAGKLTENTLAEIWNGEGMRKYRKGILDNSNASWCNVRCIKGLVNKEFLMDR